MARDPESEILQIHRDVDELAGALKKRHQERLHCRLGCTDCCIDGISVHAVEALRIRRAHPDLLDRGTPHEPGMCAFLSEDGACRIYDDRPYVCRTQGLPLRWFGETSEGEVAEYRDICPLNEEGEPLQSLPPEDCWLIGPFETQLAELQTAADPGAARVPLRSLFRCEEDPSG